MSGFRIGKKVETAEAIGALAGGVLAGSTHILYRRLHRADAAYLAEVERNEYASKVRQYFIDIVEGRRSKGVGEFDEKFDQFQFNQLFSEDSLSAKLAQKTPEERLMIELNLSDGRRTNPAAEALCHMVEQQTWNWRPSVDGVAVSPWNVLETMLQVEALRALVFTPPTRSLDMSDTQSPLRRMAAVAKDQRKFFDECCDRARIEADVQFHRGAVLNGASWVGGIIGALLAADLATRYYTNGQSIPQLMANRWK